MSNGLSPPVFSLGSPRSPPVQPSPALHSALGSGTPVQMSTPQKPVRVRFAPSPTGYLHVGGARTLFFNWLYAAKTGGTLVLRVEDTDQARSTREHEKTLLSDIARLGLTYAEGIGAGAVQTAEVGSHKPYRQSERLAIYSEYARKLRDQGKAFYCFCSDDELTKKREIALKLGRPPHYDGTCSRLSPDEVKIRLDRGERAGLRFKAPEKTMVLEDAVRGRIEFKVGTVGDFLITRTPTEEESKRPELAGVGMPVYNFCCVIDDHLMAMTHVIRGEDHLSNTARQLMIYDAFGWEVPVFAHTASVLGADRLKLSKRSGDTSVFDYLEKGYLPEALLNFLVLLGWWPAEGTQSTSGHPEVFTRDELVHLFSLERLQKAPAVFDATKLRWMNAYYMRHMPLSEIAKRARPFFDKAGVVQAQDSAWLEGVVAAVRNESELLSDLPKAAQDFLSGVPQLEAEAVTVLKEGTAGAVVGALVSEFASLPGEVFTAADVDRISKSVAATAGVKGKALFMPMRAVLTGRTHGPELKQILPILGKKQVLERIKALSGQAGLKA